MNTDHLLEDNETAHGPVTSGNPSGIRPIETATQMGQQLKQKASEATEQLKNKGSEALNQVRDQAHEIASQQRDHLLDRLDRCSAASRKAAEQLRTDNDSTMADYVETIAEQIDRGKEYLRERQFSQMIEDAENYARRRPEVFFTGMFVAGLILTRFMKASTRSEGFAGRSAQPRRPISMTETHEEEMDWGSGTITGQTEAIGVNPGSLKSNQSTPQTGTLPGCGC